MFQTHCVMDAAIVAATPFHSKPHLSAMSPKKEEHTHLLAKMDKVVSSSQVKTKSSLPLAMAGQHLEQVSTSLVPSVVHRKFEVEFNSVAIDGCRRQGRWA